MLVAFVLCFLFLLYLFHFQIFQLDSYIRFTVTDWSRLKDLWRPSALTQLWKEVRDVSVGLRLMRISRVM